jgi:hypothetical protein
LHHGEPWEKRKSKKAPKSYYVWKKQASFWTNKELPTSCLLQNLLHVSMAEIPTKLEKLAFSRVFEQKFTRGSYIVGIEHIVWYC